MVIAGRKHREALVEADDLLFVQPEQGPVQELARIPDPAPELQVRFDGLEKLAQGGLDQEIRALDARLKLLPQMLQEHLRGRAAPTGRFEECRPVAIQFHADLIAVQLTQIEAARAVFAPSVHAETAQQAQHQER